MKLVLLLFVLLLPNYVRAEGVPLSHFYTRVSSKTYGQLAKNKKLLGSNLFFPNLNQKGDDYEAHYLNGLVSYVELFDAEKIDGMKYVKGVHVGLGFFRENGKSFDSLYKTIKKKVDCEVKRYDYGESHYFVCKKGAVRLHVFHTDRNDSKSIQVTRADAAKHFRDKAGYKKEPLVVDITHVELSLKESEADLVSDFLKNIGWKKMDGQFWCLENQCVKMNVAPDQKLPKFQKVVFSLLNKANDSYAFEEFQLKAEDQFLVWSFEDKK